MSQNTGMIDSLDAASKHLENALNNYLRLCSTISTCLEPPSRAFGSRILADWVSKELPLIASYEKTMRQAKAVVSQARNFSTPLAPINVLPDEILARIFYMVHEWPPCNLEKCLGDQTTSGIRYPEFLSHVCTHWRRVATSLPSLWSHIDIAIRHNPSQISIHRGEAFAYRSGNLPITLHIDDFNSSGLFAHPALQTLCTSLSKRIQDVRIRCQLQLEDKSKTHPATILQACLAYCTSGVLQSLYIRDDGGLNTYQFIDLPPQDELDTGWLDLPADFIEQLLRPVRKLYLNGCLFHWDSGAYSGLTELQIMSTTIGISPQKLVQLLESCPHLRVLHFGIFISDSPLEEEFTPVHLSRLEVLNLCRLCRSLYPTFLRLLAPNTEPLQLSLCFNDGEPFPVPISRDFFYRANITEFYIDGPAMVRICLSDMIDILPKLRALIIANFEFYGRQLVTTDGQFDTMLAGTLPKIETLRLISSSVGVNETRLMIERYSIQNLIIWDCDYKLDDDGNWDDTIHDPPTIPPEMIERRKGYFADTGACVQIVESPLPVKGNYLSSDWENWHPWESWP